VFNAIRGCRGKWTARGASLLYVAGALLVSVDRVQACEKNAGTACDPATDPTFGSRTVVALFPAGDVFPVYVADPHRPSNAMLFRFYTHKQIPITTTRRTGLSAGGRFGMLRIDTGGPQRRSLQVSLDAGVDALFDTEYSDDAIGWDGNYGLTVTTASSGPWSLKVGVLHTSAHVGDEYEDRMHRKRLDYTREEVAIGVGWRPAARLRVYGETAHAYEMLNALQAPWRVQQGLEYETRPGLWGGRFAWFGAADLQSMQERNWRIDSALQAGIVTRSAGHTYRMLVEYYNGRPTVTEFFNTTETSITFGIRIEP
jgi:uncharacterized protein DUF1207